MTLELARQADREERVEEAASLYEAAIRSDPSQDALLDLVLLYWQATDFGYRTFRRLPDSFVKRAGERFPQLLAEARRTFPTSTEVEFWGQYIPWAYLAEPFPVEDCERLFARDRTVLVPVLYLFGQSDGRQYQPEAIELLRRSREKGTLGAKYVQGVIEGVLTRKYRHQPPFPEIGA